MGLKVGSKAAAASLASGAATAPGPSEAAEEEVATALVTVAVAWLTFDYEIIKYISIDNLRTRITNLRDNYTKIK